MIRWEREKFAIPIDELETHMHAVMSRLNDAFEKRFPLETPRDILQKQKRKQT